MKKHSIQEVETQMGFGKFTQEQKFALCTAFGKSIWTIEAWIKKGDDRLTSDKAKEALKKAKKTAA